ncbi:Pkinase-domain-containing protein [Violaceomyces palustris]|uniref:Pkinase-domain-containing protein n=1 Tax=Violaceomyces palustris TaxID=1673888 RepID=A0ACD0NRZ5_9BASI|nr:Pkinase-domain-containing protein [Violaceomyces palustris]
MPIPTSSTGQSYPTVLDYKIVQLLGGGGFSKVFRAINPNSSSHPVAAIKVISYAASSSSRTAPIDRRSLQKEVQVHSILKHPNVLEFLGAVEKLGRGSGGGGKEKGILTEAIATTKEVQRAREREKKEADERNENYVPGLYMVLELGAGGDLFDKIAPDYGVEEDLAHFYFVQLMAGLEYIHSQGVAHRDIKPENMLLDHEGNLKIADFGLCSVYKYKGREREMSGACGSLPYIAPEMNGHPYRGEPVDVWSSGVVLFALLVGNTPWDEPTRRSPEYNAYLTGELIHHDPWPRLGSDSLSLLKKMMHPNPGKRVSIEQIKRHRWYQRPNSLLTKGKCNDPVNLAEKLLQGLAVSGDISISLHTDGKRAEVPENVSLTQPEAIHQRDPLLAFGGARSDLLVGNPPSSSMMPAIETSVTDRRRLAMSQQISSRRYDLASTLANNNYNSHASATVSGGGESAPMVMESQFTQALDHFTQFGSLATSAAHRRFSPHLTRFFSSETALVVTRLVSEALDQLAVQNSVEPMGEEGSEMEEAYEFLVEGEDHQGGSEGMMRRGQAVGHGDAAAPPLVGSRGSRIRLGTMDKRKCPLRGEIRIEVLGGGGGERERGEQGEGTTTTAKCLVIMRRSKGNPLEWRRLFREICKKKGLHQSIIAT